MMSRWFRFYDAALDDPKVQRLPDPAFRAWVNLMCLASRNGGKIPENVQDLSFALRKSARKTRELLQVLISSGLVDAIENGFEPHNWAVRQYKSDVSTDRVKRSRQRSRNVDETPPDTEQIQIQKVSKTPAKADVAVPKPVLPDWIDKAAWAGFVEMRKRIRAPMTGRAEKLALAELERLANRGHDPTAVLDQSTRNSWKGLFPIKAENQNGKRQSAHDNFNAGTVLYLESLARETRGQGEDSDAADGTRQRLLSP
jgi:hypothetical protein